MIILLLQGLFSSLHTGYSKVLCTKWTLADFLHILTALVFALDTRSLGKALGCWWIELATDQIDQGSGSFSACFRHVAGLALPPPVGVGEDALQPADPSWSTESGQAGLQGLVDVW